MLLIQGFFGAISGTFQLSFSKLIEELFPAVYE